MNFDLGPDELALRDAIRDVCAKRFPIERVRKGFDRDGFSALGEAGVFSLRLPEPDGVGLGMTESVIVFEELGKALAGGPLVATHLAAGIVDGAATGDVVVTLIDGDLITFPDDNDAALLLADHVYRVDRCDAQRREPLDPLTPIGRVSPQVSGSRVAGEPRELRLHGALLTAALASGNASRTGELAVDYAKERVQFDRPIGSFQAVKHICADMFVRAEVARAAVDSAGVIIDAGDEHASTAVATAKLLACEAALANAKACIQVHGGMGFTWEIDAHLYLKRAAVLATQFGGLDAQAESVAVNL